MAGRYARRNPGDRVPDDGGHDRGPLGLLDPVSPYADCPPDLARALTAGADAARQQMETLLKAGNLTPAINGWMIPFHMFDYHLDHLGPGTIDNPEWKMADRKASHRRPYTWPAPRRRRLAHHRDPA